MLLFVITATFAASAAPSDARQSRRGPDSRRRETPRGIGLAPRLLTQRISLFGPNAAEYLEDVSAGFGPTLRDGMRAVRDRIEKAARGGV